MKRNLVRRAGILVVMVFLLVGCQKKVNSDSLIVLTGFAIGTTYLVKIAEPLAAISRDDLRRSIETRLKEVDASMSSFEPESELYKFNQYRKTDWFPLSRDVLPVVKEALRIAELTAGAFDITVGPLVDLWGFGPTGRRENVPNAEQISDKKRHVGYQKLALNENRSSLSKQDQNMMIDLSAIAKGQAVDLVAERLEDEGISNYLVEIGGEIRTRGKKPDGSSWFVAIERPVVNQRVVQKIVRLDDLSMATSGDYRNYYEIGGKRYTHMINPFTGHPVQNNVASVTIIHESCMTADGLATALMVLGSERGIPIADKNDIAALFILREEGELKEMGSRRFKEYLTKNEMK